MQLKTHCNWDLKLNQAYIPKLFNKLHWSTEGHVMRFPRCPKDLVACKVDQVQIMNSELSILP